MECVVTAYCNLKCKQDLVTSSAHLKGGKYPQEHFVSLTLAPNTLAKVNWANTAFCDDFNGNWLKLHC